MGVLWWLAIPVVAAAIAVFLMSRRGRHQTPEQQQHGIDEMVRFREALSKPLPNRNPGR